MPQLTGQPLPEGNVMIVDDNPANLKLLEDMLRQHRYEVRAFPRGRLAIAAAGQEPPDLILLDINMPEMNGYEVCEQLKSSASLAAIPVIFLSALNATEDKVKGFGSGGVDYISKPFQFEEVQARVETHIKLRRAQQAEHELLERTLGGAVRTLWELVQLTSPLLALRSQAIRDIMLRMTRQMEPKDRWQYELAATLCLVGCMALPDEVFERGYSGEQLWPDENRMFYAHPQTAARLISKIPRLEVVAEIIRRQQNPPQKARSDDPVALGAGMLHLALELDRRLYRGVTPGAALSELRSSHEFDSVMLDALRDYSPANTDFDVRRIPIQELRAGMILDSNVLSNDGSLLIFKQGTLLTETWIERLGNYAKTRGTTEPITVRIPRPLEYTS